MNTFFTVTIVTGGIKWVEFSWFSSWNQPLISHNASVWSDLTFFMTRLWFCDVFDGKHELFLPQGRCWCLWDPQPKRSTPARVNQRRQPIRAQNGPVTSSLTCRTGRRTTRKATTGPRHASAWAAAKRRGSGVRGSEVVTLCVWPCRRRGPKCGVTFLKFPCFSAAEVVIVGLTWRSVNGRLPLIYFLHSHLLK